MFGRLRLQHTRPGKMSAHACSRTHSIKVLVFYTLLYYTLYTISNYVKYCKKYIIIIISLQIDRNGATNMGEKLIFYMHMEHFVETETGQMTIYALTMLHS